MEDVADVAERPASIASTSARIRCVARGGAGRRSSGAPLPRSATCSAGAAFGRVDDSPANKRIARRRRSPALSASADEALEQAGVEMRLRQIEMDAGAPSTIRREQPVRLGARTALERLAPSCASIAFQSSCLPWSRRHSRAPPQKPSPLDGAGLRPKASGPMAISPRPPTGAHKTARRAPRRPAALSSLVLLHRAGSSAASSSRRSASRRARCCRR